MRLLLGLGYVVTAGAVAVRSVGNTTTLESTGSITGSSTTSSSQAIGNVGDYIMQGLSQAGQSSSTGEKNGTNSTTTLHTTIHSTLTIEETGTVDDWQACQSSWVSWSDEFTKTLSPTIYTTTSFDYLIHTANVTSGTGDVYTTIDGIPHARGTFTPTSIGVFTETQTQGSVGVSTHTLNINFTSPSPTCSIPFAPCSKMWQSYLLSLGITTPLDKATEPAITPMPTNRPRCSIGNASFSHTYATWDNTCLIYGDRVGLFYWPTQTNNPATPTPHITAPATTVFHNFTFTSPSVYLSFNTLYAIQGQDLDEISVTQTVPLGATPMSTTLLGGFFPEPVGPTFRNRIISLHPTELSSVIANFGPGVNTASAISEIAHGGPDYSQWILSIRDSRPVPTANNSYLIRPVDYAHLTMPDPVDYYMQPSVAPGCAQYGPHPGCSTMFEGEYRAQLWVPPQVRDLAPQWKGCGIPLDGVYDPPQALTAASREAVPVPVPVPSPTSTPVVTTSSEEARPQSTVGDPLPVVTGTSSPQQTPDPPSSTQGTPTIQQSAEGSPSPNTVSEQHDSETPSTTVEVASQPSPGSDHPPSPTKESSTLADPVQPSPTASPSEGTAVVVVGSQTLSVPTPLPSPDGTNSAEEVTPVPASTQPENALSVLLEAESTWSQPAPPSVTQPVQSEPTTPSMAAAVTLADSTLIVASPPQRTGAIKIGTATLSPGGPAVTIDGQRVSAGSQGIVVDSQTAVYAPYTVLEDPAPTSDPTGDVRGAWNSGIVVTFGSWSAFVASPTGSDHAVMFGSTTLVPGGPGITTDGHEISAASDGVVVDSRTDAYSTVLVDAVTAQTGSPAIVVTAGGHTYSFQEASGSEAVVVGGQTLTVGSPAMTISGEVVSVGSDVVVVGSQTVSFTNSGSGSPSPNIVEQSSGVFVYGFQTLTAGGAAHTVSGEVVSAVDSGVVVGGTTLSPETTLSPGTTTTTSSTTPSSSDTMTTALTTLDPARTSTLPSASPTSSQSRGSSISRRIGSCLAGLTAMMMIALLL